MKFFVLMVLCLLAICPLFISGQTIVGSEITDAQNAAPSLNVHAKCLQHFERAFKEPLNVRWRITEEGLGVKFLQHGITYDARYNHKGKWMATIRYIPVDLLEKRVAATVRRVFPHYNIFFAQQLSVPYGSIYMIKIEKGNEWKSVNVVHNTVTVTGEYVRN